MEKYIDVKLNNLDDTLEKARELDALLKEAQKVAKEISEMNIYPEITDSATSQE